MPSVRALAFALSAALALAAPAAALAARAPEGPSRGSFRAGSLSGGVRVPDEGLDHYLLFPPRCAGTTTADANAWGHPRVVETVLAVARDVRRALPSAARLAVGDLSGREGGKIPHHLSHQNGLDVDVWFGGRALPSPEALTAPPAPTARAGELTRCVYPRGYEERDPATTRWRVADAFDPELVWRMAEGFAARPEVKIIFVGGLIREALAAWAKDHGVPAKARARTLGKLYAVFCRPPKGVVMDSYRGNWCPHDDHLHVRFRCPRDSPTCRDR